MESVRLKNDLCAHPGAEQVAVLTARIVELLPSELEPQTLNLFLFITWGAALL
jgi:hypothetical protein